MSVMPCGVTDSHIINPKKGKIMRTMDKFDRIAHTMGFTPTYTGSNIRSLYSYNKGNAKGETLQIDMSVSSGVTLPTTWLKKGYTKELITDWWCVDTFVTNKDGECYKDYDPTCKPSDDGKRWVVDFDWHLKATEENFVKLLTEILRRFNG